MISAAVKNLNIPSDQLCLVPNELVSLLPKFEQEPYFQQWFEQPASSITEHDGRCCKEARSWFRSFAQSMQASLSSDSDAVKSPLWLSQKFTWGPSRWPIAWCEVVQSKIIDCGVFAALARECFEVSGIKAHPGQVILEYSQDCTSHWNEYWSHGAKEIESAEQSKIRWLKDPLRFFPWIGNQLVYHEICFVELGGGKTKLYDSTWGQWYSSTHLKGHASLLAARGEWGTDTLSWDNKSLVSGEWSILT